MQMYSCVVYYGKKILEINRVDAKKKKKVVDRARVSHFAQRWVWKKGMII
jgi:hypothetical protein